MIEDDAPKKGEKRKRESDDDVYEISDDDDDNATIATIVNISSNQKQLSSLIYQFDQRVVAAKESYSFNDLYVSYDLIHQVRYTPIREYYLQDSIPAQSQLIEVKRFTNEQMNLIKRNDHMTSEELAKEVARYEELHRGYVDTTYERSLAVEKQKYERQPPPLKSVNDMSDVVLD
ncbi:hypothetical protein E3N88_13366 [Mikania micrantha]|uniref:Uncharacterized protein n=1 Tax=Mikania micrantha TaxID=192012 RepID=A0A5N6PAP3_9ASTR|nr:hypothetical protein E3N88_13366 [Mikania micrantha]